MINPGLDYPIMIFEDKKKDTNPSFQILYGMKKGAELKKKQH